MSETDVVIVGAGPAGLAAAIELGSRGIPCLLIERQDRVGYAPRAKTTNVRTRTHLRRWGIADKLAAAAPFGLDYPSHVVFVTSLAGKELARIPHALNMDPARSPHYPEHAQWIPQYKLEQVMRAHVATLPSVAVRFSTEFLGADQTDDAVTVRLRDKTTNTESTVPCRYLIGADGARSRVREVIGATLKGNYGLSRNYNVVFKAPGLAKAHNHGPAIMYWQLNGDASSLLGPMDEDEKWYFMPTKLLAGVTLSDHEAMARIAASTGIDLPYQPLSNDEWVASRLIADKYRQDRIFLAGDACHLHPPFGGYGMNMGVGDSVDLGWKLAAVLQGWAAPDLLLSYEGERRQIHEYIMDEAVANHAMLGNELWQPGLADETPEGEALRTQLRPRIETAKQREFYTLGAVIGYRYENSSVIADDGSTAEPLNSQIYVPSSRPGHLAPHVWLDDGSSLYDLFGQGFTLIAKAGSDAKDLDQARQEAAARHLPLSIIAADETVGAAYDHTLTLIRPDQHVAWRGTSWPGESLFDLVTGRGRKKNG